jgi:hypothetical protein
VYNIVHGSRAYMRARVCVCPRKVKKTPQLMGRLPLSPSQKSIKVQFSKTLDQCPRIRSFVREDAVSKGRRDKIIVIFFLVPDFGREERKIVNKKKGGLYI